jgi:hypothetical protein
VRSSDSALIFSRERRAERAAARIRRRSLRVLRDLHVSLDGLQLEDDRLFVLAASDAHVLQHARLEAGKLRLDLIAAGHQILRRRESLVRGLERRDRVRLGCGVGAGDRRWRRQHAAGRIHDA